MATHNAAKESGYPAPLIYLPIYVCGSSAFVNIAVDGALVAAIGCRVDQDRMVWRLTTAFRMTLSIEWKDAL
jgi:hypothetical protein